MKGKMLTWPVYSCYVIMAFVILTVCGGCSHSMRITNIDEYYSPPQAASKQSIKLGVTSTNTNSMQNSKYISAIVDSLQRNSNVEKVIYPYSQAMHKGVVDAVVDIYVHPRYDGKGSNFFVNWPGFLIFAPAIWGYGYTANIDTDAVVTNVSNGNIRKITIPVKYEFRQAEINRTWTEVGWFEVGIIPLIGGIVFMDYDADITNEFIRNASPSYGSYIASKIVETACDCLGPSQKENGK